MKALSVRFSYTCQKTQNNRGFTSWTLASLLHKGNPEVGSAMLESQLHKVASRCPGIFCSLRHHPWGGALHHCPGMSIRAPMGTPGEKKKQGKEQRVHTPHPLFPQVSWKVPPVFWFHFTGCNFVSWPCPASRKVGRHSHHL